MTSSRPAFARWLHNTNAVTETFLSASERQGMINLGGGLPAPEIWPAEEFAEIAAKVMREKTAAALAYTPIAGLPELRDLIASRFGGAARGLSRDNVLIVSGGMQALHLYGLTLIEEGQLIACQTPTYLGAIDGWRPFHPTYRPMDLEAAGFDAVAALEGAQFAYTVPNFSNPTGKQVGLERRKALVAAARQTGTWLVEDDPYGALQYDGAPVARLIELALEGHSAARPYDGPVIHMGTTSKELAPGLRIGWIVAAPQMIRALTAGKLVDDMCTSGVNQLIAVEAFSNGLAERMLPPMVTLYRARRDALHAALLKHCGGLLDWEKPVGGMFIWARAKDPALDTDALLAAALERGVCYSPSSVFDPLGSDRGAIRLNFTLNPPDKLEEAARRLAQAINDVVRKAA